MSSIYNLLMRNLEDNTNNNKEAKMVRIAHNAVQNENGPIKGEMAKGKGKVNSSIAGTSASKQTGNLDSMCHKCKQMLVDEDAKVLSYDRCELWYSITCVNISEV